MGRLIIEPDNKIGLNDKDLKGIKVKIKMKRRALKNRGYAAGSRSRRNSEEKTLENEEQNIQDKIRTIEEEKAYLEEKLEKLRESTRFRVAWSHAQGIILPEEYYKYLDEK